MLNHLQAASPDSLVDVLERMRIQETQHFRYREIRMMRMLVDPSKAMGDMYISPHRLVISQQSPRLTTTAISAERMLYIDDDQEIYRSLKLERPFAVPGMEPFMWLVFGSGGLADLEKEYKIEFNTGGQRWRLQLTPHNYGEHDIARFWVSGNTGLGPDNLLLEYADGDRSEWQLLVQSRGGAAEQEMRRTLDQLRNCQIPLDCG
jgi:hypothetical protein